MTACVLVEQRLYKNYDGVKRWITHLHEQDILFCAFVVQFWCSCSCLKWNIKSSSTWFSTVETHKCGISWCFLVLESFVAAGQLVEKLLIERVALRTAACRHEDVASDKLVNDFAVGGHAAKSDVDVAFKLYGHLSYVPVDVPLLHVVVAPRLHHIAHAQVDTDQTVGSDAQHLVFPTALKPDDDV